MSRRTDPQVYAAVMAQMDAVALAERAVRLNDKLLARLQEAESIIRQFVEFIDADEKRWQELTAGGETELLLSVARRVAIARVNAKKAIDPQLRVKAKKLNEEFASQLPTKTQRYAWIAVQLDDKPDRIRYIIDGPRRKKKK